jgi:hypothetical protein
MVVNKNYHLVKRIAIVIILTICISFSVGFCTGRASAQETELDGSVLKHDKEDVATGFFLFGLKRMAEKMKPSWRSPTVIKLSFDNLYVPSNSGLVWPYHCAQVYKLNKDNWFYKKGLRSGDFIYNILHITKKGPEHLSVKTLQTGEFYDIIKPESEVFFWVYRVIEWKNREILLPEIVAVHEIKIK